MKSYKEILKDINTLIFDVDGVLTDSSILLLPPNEMIRTMNTRDGYALQKAVKAGINVCIITGGNSMSVKSRLEYLGIPDIYMASKDKIADFEDYLAKKGVTKEQVMYMGDDIPDYEVMQLVGLPTCPHDAAEEIKAISRYVSPKDGGKGAVRDITEQILKIHGLWMVDKTQAI